MTTRDHYAVRKTLAVGSSQYHYYSLSDLEAKFEDISKLPFSIKVLLEAAIRQFDGRAITEEHVAQIAGWAKNKDENKEIPFIPSRIVLQDFTGVPVVVDLAAMRDTVKKKGG
ncbi:MAG TPA: aconitate hydratase, partial [Paenibacillus sp.]|nr:aconitate hydratase [Paenibacillus sp.]